MQPVSLTIRERFDLIKYTHRLPCTLKLRLAVDEFFNSLEITDEESSKYGIEVNPATFELVCNDDNYTVVYDSFSENMISALKDYVTGFDTEENKENTTLQKAFVIFKKVINS